MDYPGTENTKTLLAGCSPLRAAEQTRPLPPTGARRAVATSLLAGEGACCAVIQLGSSTDWDLFPAKAPPPPNVAAALLGLLLDLGGHALGSLLAALERRVDLAHVRGHLGDVDIDVKRAAPHLGGRVVAPDEEGDLEEEVEGDPREHEVRDGLREVEEGVDDPVGEPLGVVARAGRVDGLERHVGRVDEAHEAHHQLLAAHHEQQDARQQRAHAEDVELVHARLLLQLHDLLVALQLGRDLLLVLQQLVHACASSQRLCGSQTVAARLGLLSKVIPPPPGWSEGMGFRGPFRPISAGSRPSNRRADTLAAPDSPSTGAGFLVHRARPAAVSCGASKA
ncbi:hypothetical protein ON010_g12017 [Phytophthora cinnamomi]|nr:hypothetical protein ON010_g12017 [Phytophthora cinnamomi]